MIPPRYARARLNTTVCWEMSQRRLEVVHVPDRAASGQAGVPAFDEFFAAESDTLYRRMRLVTRDHHEAEEVIQDAFLEMYERWDRISARRPRGSRGGRA